MGVFVYRSQRNEVRRSITVPCQVVRERDFRLVGDVAIDLSPDGMLVVAKESVRPGESVIVSFQATPLGLWFDTDGVVRRVLGGRRRVDRDTPAFAIAFDSLDHVQRLILRNHLRRYPPPLPQRPLVIDYARTVGKILSISSAA